MTANFARILSICLVSLAGCQANTSLDEDKSTNRKPKTFYGQSVGKARDLSGQLSGHDRGVGEQAAELDDD